MFTSQMIANMAREFGSGGLQQKLSDLYNYPESANAYAKQKWAYDIAKDAATPGPKKTGYTTVADAAKSVVPPEPVEPAEPPDPNELAKQMLDRIGQYAKGANLAGLIGGMRFGQPVWKSGIGSELATGAALGSGMTQAGFKIADPLRTAMAQQNAAAAANSPLRRAYQGWLAAKQ